MTKDQIEIPLQHEKTLSYRLLEILPGVLTWTILSTPIILSFVNVTLASYFVIFFMVGWLVKALVMSFRVVQGYRRMNRYMVTDWNRYLLDIANIDTALTHAYERRGVDRQHRWYYERLRDYVSSHEEQIAPDEVIHLVMVAIYNESMEVVEPTIKSVVDSDYDTSKMILVIAYEERGGYAAEEVATTLIDRYGEQFMHAEAIGHPDGMPDEIVGKGGNITYAGHEIAKYVKKQKLDPEKVLLTTLDSDNRPHKKYFSALTFFYITAVDRKHKSFQPVPMYLNNIWDAPAPMRVLATGNSFFQVVQSVRPHMLRNFSAHAQSFKSLLDTNFWSVRTIVEDGHQFWRTYFRYDGKHETIAIFVPVYQDAVMDTSYKKTLRAQFIQLRRWAWGASDIAYVGTKAFLTPNKIPFWDKFFKLLRLIEVHVSWSTAPLVLAFSAWAPTLANYGQTSEDILVYQLPVVASYLQTLALVFGLPITIYLSFKILPKRPPHYKRRRTLWMLLQWVWLPPASILYGASSALYSQTRLMFGKYLDKFDVTVKHVK